MKFLSALMAVLTMIGFGAQPIEFKDGSLVGVSENDFIINRAEARMDGEYGYYSYVPPSTGESGEYYKIGSLDIPEGLTEDPDVISSIDRYKQNFSYIVNDTEALSEKVVFIGCTKNWDELIVNIESSVVFSENGVEYSERYDRFSPIKGNAYHGMMQKYTERNEENGYYYMFAYAYVETGAEDACVMIQYTYKAAYKKDIPDFETALDELEAYVDMINGLK